MIDASEVFLPSHEVPAVDPGDYERMLDAGSRQLDALAQEQPWQSVLVASTQFWDERPTIIESLRSETYADTTLSVLDGLARAGSFSPGRGGLAIKAPAEGLAHQTGEQLLDGELDALLMDMAEADPDSARARQIADTLFVAASSIAPSSRSPRLSRFLTAHLPTILETAALKAQERQQAVAHLSGERALVVRREYAVANRYAHSAARMLECWDCASPDAADGLKGVLYELAYLSETNTYANLTLQSVANHDTAIDKVCDLLGVPGFRVRIAWGIGYGAKDKAEVMQPQEYNTQCLVRMLRLESQQPGICRTLYRQFGIRNFGRFPESMLMGQYLERNTPYQHRVYLLSATEDNNGSSATNSMPKFEQLRQQLHDRGVGMTLVEVADGREVRRLARLARMARWPLAAAVIVDSHGTAWSLALGYDRITTSDLRDWAGQLAADLSRPDAIIFLDVCSTAQDEDGFAPQLNMYANREVLGATGGMYLKQIDIRIDESGRPSMDVEIGKTVLERFLPAPTERSDSALFARIAEREQAVLDFVAEHSSALQVVFLAAD